MVRSLKKEDGITIIEVVVAALVLTLGGLATFGALSAATVNNQRAQGTQVALDRAQQELEKLSALPYEQLALTEVPPSSSEPKNPDYRVKTNTAQFALTREPRGSYANLAYNGDGLYGGGLLEGGTVKPGPTPFTSGSIKGQVYRYVVWRNDSSCPTSACPGEQDYKQIVIAVKLETLANESGSRGYVEVQSSFIDPKSIPSGDPAPPCAGCEVTSPQQFFLSDTTCTTSGATERMVPTADHPLHNTRGTCASGPQTGSTIGAPDALLLGPPPGPATEGAALPPLYNYSNDYPGLLSGEPRGLQIRRDDSAGCHEKPTGTSAPQWQVHRWVTDPLPANFVMSESVTLDFFTRTLSGTGSGTLCAYLFYLDEGHGTETWLHDKANSSHDYWEVKPSGNGNWPRGEWIEMQATMKFAGPVTIPRGDRLGFQFTVNGSSKIEAISIAYDNPAYRTRIEVDTPTPLEGG
ncbi:MAG: type IV pilus modification PilV family protein [Solirubrobacterales bacterium]